MVVISYEKFLKEKNAILIDARTPKEFKQEPIPGAINIPILLDDERVEVGTAYKQVSQEEAKRLGVKFLAKRFEEVFEKINELSKTYKKLVFYCARGGMRSSILVNLFSAMGYRTSKIEGGYKSYRTYVSQMIPKLNEGVEYIVVQGKTGIGKTKVLNEIKEAGYSVLDLEKHADHKGSFYGAICESREQSQKRFESELLRELRGNKSGYFIVESESKRIGDLYIPDSIFDSMKKGSRVLLDTPIEKRVEVIMEDYFDNGPKDEIVACTMKLNRYLSKERVEVYLKMIEDKRMEELAKELMENYYDPLYKKSIDKYEYMGEIYYETFKEGSEKLAKVVDEILKTKGIVEE